MPKINPIKLFELYRINLLSAQNKTRTCTPLRAPAPQAGVSTNFTIWAISISKKRGAKL